MLSLYFCGVGGVAMANAAAMFKRAGYKISGSDTHVFDPMRSYLIEQGIEFNEEFSDQNIISSKADFFVIGNAISRGNIELETILDSGRKYISLPELLKQNILNSRKNIVITGTHGKTTTTSLCAFLLSDNGLDCGFFIGGQDQNFSNSAKIGQEGNYFVIEGDEYDTCFNDKRSKFFHYLPKIFVIGNLEFDHADIFQDLDQIKKSFILALRQVSARGRIIVNGDDQNALEVAKAGFTPIVTFGKGAENDYVIDSTVLSPSETSFTIRHQGRNYLVKTKLMGDFNIRNCTAAFVVGMECGLSFEQIKNSLLKFKPPLRRLTVLTRNTNSIVIDDFAHHPTAITESINAVRETYPAQKLIIIYEARSATSLGKTHQATLLPAFSKADQLAIIPSQRWQTMPEIKRIDLNQIIADSTLKRPSNLYFDKIELFNELKLADKGSTVYLILSQSDLSGEPKLLAKHLDSKYIK